MNFSKICGEYIYSKIITEKIFFVKETLLKRKKSKMCNNFLQQQNDDFLYVHLLRITIREYKV